MASEVRAKGSAKKSAQEKVQMGEEEMVAEIRKLGYRQQTICDFCSAERHKQGVDTGSKLLEEFLTLKKNTTVHRGTSLCETCKNKPTGTGRPSIGHQKNVNFARHTGGRTSPEM